MLYEPTLFRPPPMKQGLWVWPSDPRKQRRILRTISESDHLIAALKAIAKSKEGLSNAELDDIINDNSNWMTLWTIRQLTALGFIDFKVDFFGNPAKYTLTDLGRGALQKSRASPLLRPNLQLRKPLQSRHHLLRRHQQPHRVQLPRAKQFCESFQAQ